MEATDDAFWDQFWDDSSTSVQDIFALVPSAEIRAVREESPSNLATLCYKVSRHRTCVCSPIVMSPLSSSSVLETGADSGMPRFMDPALEMCLCVCVC